MARQYPPPAQQASVEEMLARPPQKWSLGHYVKNAREAKIFSPNKEQKEREFANAKRELLAAGEEIRRLTPSRR